MINYINLFKRVEQFIFGHNCILCKFDSDQTDNLCSYCEASLPTMNDRCYQCGVRLYEEGEHIYCYRCQNFPPSFERLIAAFSYNDHLKKMIHHIKFNSRLDILNVLSKYLIKKLNDEYIGKDIDDGNVNDIFNIKNKINGKKLPEIIIPVPLHKSRLRQRGFNQALEIAKIIGKNFEIPVVNYLVERVKDTKPQAMLKKENKYWNTKNAFQVVNKKKITKRIINLKKIKNQDKERDKIKELNALNNMLATSNKKTAKITNRTTVAIVDDVVTTKSTVNALTKALTNSLNVEVEIWCICRV